MNMWNGINISKTNKTEYFVYKTILLFKVKMCASEAIVENQQFYIEFYIIMWQQGGGR